MKFCLRILGVLLLSGTLTMAASIRFVSTWKNPAAGAIDVSGQRVAAFVVSSDETMRLGPEETLATELRQRGIDCIAGYTVLPGELAKDTDKAKEFKKRLPVQY